MAFSVKGTVYDIRAEQADKAWQPVDEVLRGEKRYRLGPYGAQLVTLTPEADGVSLHYVAGADIVIVEDPEPRTVHFKADDMGELHVGFTVGQRK